MPEIEPVKPEIFFHNAEHIVLIFIFKLCRLEFVSFCLCVYSILNK